MTFGLEQHIIDKIISVFEANAKVDKAYVFGSRAKGNYRPDSDIDIAIKGIDITLDDILKMSVAFEDKGIKNKIDLIDYTSIKEPALQEHIDRVGIEFYSRWKEYILGDVINLKRGYDLASQNRKAGSIPIFSSSGITDHHNVSMKEGPGVITGRYGTIGKVFYTDEPYWPLNTTLYVQNFRGNLPKYIFYFLQGLDFEKYSDKSAVPGVNRNELHKEIVVLPPLPEQTAIASILSSLDDKIDLLQRQNITLEQLAETLFRQWFVEEAEESWEVVKLEKLGKIICGKTPSKKIADYFNGEIPFIKIPDMHGNTFVFDSEDSLTIEGLDSQQNKTIPPKSICVSCIATVGLVVMNAKTAQTNQQINSIIPAKEVYRYFLYLKMLSMKDDLLAMASGGTATDNLNTGDFSKIDIQLPDQNKLNDFHETIHPIFEKIYTNHTQIRTITQTRDTLLPKLMSGEVRVALDN
ncbi:MAG TPA: restriction endonuclease subunit S [Prolixibacteraceae bacterium]|nr:restriction endonuclease subunit S [Prolixibacteraceae bacterium]